MPSRNFQFPEFHSSAWLAFCVFAALVAAALIVLLMRYERRLVPRRVGNVLLALRLMVLVLLFLALGGPVLRRTIDRREAGRIIVAVDVSESMGTTDGHARPHEKLRWARALGMIGNREIDRRLDSWIDAYQHNREPQWVDENEEPDPQRRREIATARRENLESVFTALDQMSRKEIAHKLLTQTTSPLLPLLEKIGNVELLLFAGNAQSADKDSLGKLLTDPPEGLLTSKSDLWQSLTSPGNDSDAPTTRAVVIFSDGRDNSRRVSLGGSEGPDGLPVSVFPIMLGSEHKPRDLSIASLDHPLTVSRNDVPLLKAILNTSGFEGQQLTVTLQRGPSKPVSKTITPRGDTASIEFKLDAGTLGRHVYTLKTDVQPGELRDDNNSRSFAINVVDDKIHVLLIDGEARWEFRYLHNALSRDRNVDVKGVVFRQPYMGILDDTFFPRKLADLADKANNQESKQPEESPFDEVDLVILGDVAPDDFPASAWRQLEKFVDEAGGTLVFVAGKRFFPQAHKSPIAKKLLPLVDLRKIDITGARALGSPTERGFHLRLTPDGLHEAMFQFDADLSRNRTIWAELPGHLWGIVGQAKRGATVFATADTHELNGQTSSIDAERRNAVIAHQYYGRGQVMWLGIDSTWRWRHRVGDRYHHRFWGQLGRWAANYKASSGNEFVRFGPEQSEVEVGDNVMIRARWSRRFQRRFPKFSAHVEIYRTKSDGPDELFARLDLNPVETQPLVHEARLVAPPVGDYRIELRVADADLGPDEIVAPLHVNPQRTAELSDLTANPQLLRELADASGGRFLFPDEISKLTELLKSPEQSTKAQHETELWDHWLLLVGFFVLLTAGWAIRKLSGLP